MSFTLTAPSITQSAPHISTTQRQMYRERAYHLHAIFNRVSSTSSGNNCDRSRRGGAAGISLRKTYTDKGVKASWSKQSCGSRFCPRCSPIQSFLDRRRIALAVEQHTADGGTTLFITFTAKTAESRTPQFANAEYAFRHDQDAFTTFRNEDAAFPRVGARQRLKAAAAAYGDSHGIPVASHEQWELAQRLTAFRSALSRSVFEKGGWKQERERFGVKGRLDVLELVPTPRVNADGTRNWNYVAHNLHFHVVLFCSERLSDAEQGEFVTALRDRWTASLARKGFKATDAAQDFKWVAANDVARVAHYITKFADEVARGKSKDSLSVWDALRDVGGGEIVNGKLLPPNISALNWFRQVEQVFLGKRLMNTSIGFFKKMGVDARLAELEEEFRKTSITEIVLTFDGHTWRLLHEDNPELKWEILNVAENASSDALYEFVEDTGYHFTRTETPTLDDVPDSDDEPF